MRDFDRPLNARGRSAAPLIGAYCAKNGVTPALILCSPAARTRETLALIAPFLRHRPPVIFKDALYLASADRLIEEIRAAPKSDKSVMVIGHNSGLEEAAYALADTETSDPPALQDLARKFPTGALASLEFKTDLWTDVSIGSGGLTRFVTPRSIAGE